ncbi:CoA transferase [Bradyrhizobium sp. Rc2d]|uniref:CoA transferase n=1 Tax=Bradyrhizobium sp. Rc2d TaxID=1855321 RepID=UPI0024BFF204|nr:CoA transferase [Bradyrhizobium sp. Rc2d]
MIYIEASWFGREGPYAGFVAIDSTVRALAGLIKLAGPTEGPPLHAPDFQTGILAGLWGFIAAASSAAAGIQQGSKRWSWSLSIFESSLALSEYQIFEAYERGDVKRLVAGADIVVDNYSADVLPKLGAWLRRSQYAQPSPYHDVDVCLWKE